MKKDYVLITPVHNEEEFIEETIKSVVSQSVLPMRWIIVDDASEDKTQQIIAKYQGKYDLIEYDRLERGEVKSYYSRRTHVFLAGYEKVRHMEFDFIAALDADLQLGQDYYEGILREFDSNVKLGVASGVYLDLIDGYPRKVLRSDISTSGGLQVFRRECYEQIGGYVPLRYGGDDSLAEYTARMNGWQTSSFPAYQAIHKRPVGTRGKASILQARYRQGMTDYYLGTHILFMLAKSLRRALLEKPYIMGAVSRMAGFMAGCFSSEKINIPDEVLKYIRKEQLLRLWSVTRK
jgi:poly-beta-1,6-N-acetyl-D-glucosamine synthase